MENLNGKFINDKDILGKIIDSVPYFCYIVNKQGDIVYANKTANEKLEELGVTYIDNIYDYLDRYEFLCMNGKKLIKKNCSIYHTLNYKKEIKEVPFVCKMKDGKEVYISISSTPLELENNLVGAIISLRDITEEYLSKKMIEKDKEKLIKVSEELKDKCSIIEILREKELEHIRYLRDVINNVSEGIIVFDNNQKLSLCNKSVRGILDIKPSDIMNPEKLLNYYDLYLMNEDQKFSDKLIRLKLKLKEETKNLIVKVINKRDDSIKYIEYNSVPIINKSGSVVYTIITIKDITDLKKHQVIAQENENFIKDIVNTLEVPIAVLDYPELKYRLVNKKYEELVSNYTEKPLIDSVIGKNINEVFTPKEFDERVKVLDLIGKNCGRYTFSPRKIRDNNGEERFYKIKYIYHKRNINPRRIHIHGSDVTEEIKHNIELQNITRLKDEFFTVISHELRTPITIIYSSLQLANDIYNEEVTPNIRKILNRIKQNSGRLLKLINNTLDISKAEAGFLTSNNSYFNIVEETENIVNSIINYSNLKNIQLIFDTNEEEAEVCIDKNKYERILLNLLSNAIKFTAENKSIYIFLNIREEEFELIVKDEGIGIPEDKLDFIFDRFAQVNSSLSRNAEGTGIGLALVKKIVDFMNGEINVTSEINKGSIFTVKLKRKLNETKNEIVPPVIHSDINNKINIEFSDIN